MITALERPDAVVLDGVLPATDFAALREFLAEGRFSSVHAGGWDKAWGLSDGEPLRAPATYLDPAGRLRGESSAYPTGTPIDALIDAVREAARSHPSVVGSERAEWDSMCLVPWLYPPGSGLRFHRDDGSYRGSFTFFLSGEWQLDWGGLLLLASRGSTIEHTQIGWDGASKPLSDSASWGSYVCPRANRLALIGPACGHMITRVDRNAGSRVRASVAGFFLRGSA